ISVLMPLNAISVAGVPPLVPTTEPVPVARSVIVQVVLSAVEPISVSLPPRESSDAKPLNAIAAPKPADGGADAVSTLPCVSTATQSPCVGHETPTIAPSAVCETCHGPATGLFEVTARPLE